MIFHSSVIRDYWIILVILRTSRRCPISYPTPTLHFLSQVNQLPETPPPVVTAIKAKAEPDALHTQDAWYPGDSGILQIPATQSHSHSDSHIDQNITLCLSTAATLRLSPVGVVRNDLAQLQQLDCGLDFPPVPPVQK